MPKTESTQSDNLKRIANQYPISEGAISEILKLVEKAEQEARVEELERLCEQYRIGREPYVQYAQYKMWKARIKELREEK